MEERLIHHTGIHDEARQDNARYADPPIASGERLSVSIPRILSMQWPPYHLNDEHRLADTLGLHPLYPLWNRFSLV